MPFFLVVATVIIYNNLNAELYVPWPTSTPLMPANTNRTCESIDCKMLRSLVTTNLNLNEHYNDNKLVARFYDSRMLIVYSLLLKYF